MRVLVCYKTNDYFSMLTTIISPISANRTVEFTDVINSFAVATSDRTFTVVGNTTEKITNELKPNLNQGAFMYVQGRRMYNFQLDAGKLLHPRRS